MTMAAAGSSAKPGGGGDRTLPTGGKTPSKISRWRRLPPGGRLFNLTRAIVFIILTVLFLFVGWRILPDRPPLAWPDSINISVDSAAPLDQVIVSVGAVTPGTTDIAVTAIPKDQGTPRGDLTIKMTTYGGPTTLGVSKFDPCTSKECVAVNDGERDFRTSWDALGPLSLVETGSGPVKMGVQAEAVASGAQFGYVTNDVDLRALLPAVNVTAGGSGPVTVVRRLNEFSNAWSFEWNSDAHIEDEKIIGETGMENIDVAALTWPSTLTLQGGSGYLDEYRAVARNPGVAASDADATFRAGIFLGIAGAALIVAVDAGLLALKGPVQEVGTETAPTPTPGPEPMQPAQDAPRQAPPTNSGKKRRDQGAQQHHES